MLLERPALDSAPVEVGMKSVIAEVELLKSALSRKAEEVQRLSADEAMLVQDVTAEQNRWADFNQRLDDLERALNRR